MTSHLDNITDLLVERVLQVLDSGVTVGELHFYLKNDQDDDGKVASHAALGKLFSGMLLYPPGPQKNDLASFAKLEIDCGDSALWQFEALCSALSASRAPITKLHLTDVCSYRKKGEARGQYWKLLAKTFFHTRACTRRPFSSVRGLRLYDVKLTLDDLAEITAVLRQKEQQEAIAQQWDICQKSWALRKNTTLQFTEADGDKKKKRALVTGDSFSLSVDTPVELVESNSDKTDNESENDRRDVIIPGYGQCRVSRDSVVAVPATKQLEGEPLTSLSLSFKTDAEGVEGLLKEIGWSLCKLSLSFHREIDVSAMIPSILSSCPNVTKLSLGESFIDLDRFSTTYESGSEKNSPTILSLDFQDLYGIGEGDGKLFMKHLGDPSTRMGKHLRELTIYAEEYAEPVDHPTLSELWIAMGKNSTLEKLDVMVSRTVWSAIWKRRLRQFNGQLLPPRPLPSSCKLAFLSVTRTENASNDISAIQQLDQHILSLIFEFAATRVVRTVLVRG